MYGHKKNKPAVFYKTVRLLFGQILAFDYTNVSHVLIFV